MYFLSDYVQVYKVGEMGYQENWQLVSKVYRAFNERTKKKAEMSWETQIQNALNFTQAHPHQPEKPTESCNKKFDSVKTPLRMLWESDKIEGNRNIQSNALGMVDKIKHILVKDEKNDRVKVRLLKNLLNIDFDSKDDDEIKDILTDGKKSDTIVID